MRLIAIALLSVVLPVMTVPSHAKRCTVTVVLADHAGNQQPKTAKEQPCRPGETGGGVEVYNPYTGIYVFHPQIPPLTPELVNQQACQVRIRVRTTTRRRPHLALPGQPVRRASCSHCSRANMPVGPL